MWFHKLNNIDTRVIIFIFIVLDTLTWYIQQNIIDILIFMNYTCSSMITLHGNVYLFLVVANSPTLPRVMHSGSCLYSYYIYCASAKVDGYESLKPKTLVIFLFLLLMKPSEITGCHE